jgi:trypsin
MSRLGGFNITKAFGMSILVGLVGYGVQPMGFGSPVYAKESQALSAQTPEGQESVTERGVAPLVRDHRKQSTPLPSVSAPAQGTNGPSSVVGGTFEPDYRYPWVVRRNGCFGVLIDPKWVLTAAHCVAPGLGVSDWVYYRTHPHTGAGHTDTRAPDPSVAPFIHPMYVFGKEDYDLALVKLKQPFALNSDIQTVGLPRSPRQPGVVGTVASFSHSEPLPTGHFAIFRAPIPPSTYPLLFEIRANAATASLCPGDSGSGFVTVENGRATVRGIASNATVTDCKTPSGIASFTDVFTKRDWILQSMGKTDASLSGNTRVRWSGRAARGVMGVKCNNPYGTLWGPLNVVGVEVGAVCGTSLSPQEVMCNLEEVQDRVGPVAPTITGFTLKTTLASGATEVRSLPFSGKSARYSNVSLGVGIRDREFICQIGIPIAPITQGNAPILRRGIEGEPPAEPASSEQTEPSSGTTK